MMVALVGLLKEFEQLPLTDYEIADLACVIEREELGIEGGLQDLSIVLDRRIGIVEQFERCLGRNGTLAQQQREDQPGGGGSDPRCQ